MDKGIRLDIFEVRGVLAPCDCGSAYEIIAGVDRSGGLHRPIFSVACMNCKEVFKSAPHIEEAVEHFMLDRRNE